MVYQPFKRCSLCQWCLCGRGIWTNPSLSSFYVGCYNDRLLLTAIEPLKLLALLLNNYYLALISPGWIWRLLLIIASIPLATITREPHRHTEMGLAAQAIHAEEAHISWSRTSMSSWEVENTITHPCSCAARRDDEKDTTARPTHWRPSTPMRHPLMISDRDSIVVDMYGTLYWTPCIISFSYRPRPGPWSR
jgi:hypothetical protein